MLPFSADRITSFGQVSKSDVQQVALLTTLLYLCSEKIVSVVDL